MLNYIVTSRRAVVMCAMAPKPQAPGRRATSSRPAGQPQQQFKKLAGHAAAAPVKATPKVPNKEVKVENLPQIDSLLARLSSKQRRASGSHDSPNGRDSSLTNKAHGAAALHSMGGAPASHAAPMSPKTTSSLTRPDSASVAATLAAAIASSSKAMPPLATAASARPAARKAATPTPKAASARRDSMPGGHASKKAEQRKEAEQPVHDVHDLDLTEQEMDSLFEEVEAAVLRDAKGKKGSGREASLSRVEDDDDSGLGGWSQGRGLQALIEDQEQEATTDAGQDLLASAARSPAGQEQDSVAHADSKGSGAPPLAAAAAAAPNKSSQSSASGFKGFGLPPGTCSTVSGSGSSSSTAVAATASAGRKGLAAAAAARSDVPVLRIFLYAAEAAKTKTSIEEAGLLGQVEVVEELKQAQAIVSCKVSGSGSHNRLQQGERTAANMGVPFVCVGRKMTATNLSAALAPLLAAHQASKGSAKASLRDAVASSRSTARPEGEWRSRMAEQLGLI